MKFAMLIDMNLIGSSMHSMNFSGSVATIIIPDNSSGQNMLREYRESTHDFLKAN